MLPQKKLFLAGTIGGVFSMLMIGILLMNALVANTVTLTDAQKKEILTQIIKNNSGSLFSKGGASPESATVATDAGSLIAPLRIRPDTQDYNYRHSTTIYTNGPAVETCKYYSSSDSGYSAVESYEFYGDNSFYSKYTSKDKNKNLTSYTLTTTDSENSSTIEYRGGNYAVKWNYNVGLAATTGSGVAVDSTIDPLELPKTDVAPSPESDPATPPSDPEIDYTNLITQYFGEDADVVDVINKDGKTYYVIQYSYQASCSEDVKPLYDMVSSYSDALDSKIIVQNTVDSTTFEIVKNSNYLNSVSSANLLTSFQATTETQKTTLETIKSNFDFEYSVNIKAIENTTYDPNLEATNLVSYLKKQDLALILVQNSDAILQSVYSNKAYQESDSTINFLMDRGFYPSGSVGDGMYQAYVDLVGEDQMPILNLSYAFNVNSTYDTVSISAYDQSVDIESHLKSDKQTTSSKMNINIDGSDVEGTLYTYTYEPLTEPVTKDSESSSSSDSIAPVPPDVAYKYQELYLEYKGKKYTFNFPTNSDFDLTKLKFKTIQTTNASQINSFGNEIINVYVNNYTGGSSGSGSTPDAKPL